MMNMGFMAARSAILSGHTPPPPSHQGGTVAGAPLFHIGGIASMTGTMASGSKIVLLHRWDLEEALSLAVSERVTNFGGVPAIARQILYRPGVGELGLEVSGFAIGGAAVPPDLPRRAVEVFGDSIQILNGYGLTETTSAVVSNVGAEYAARPDSVGRTNLTADLRVERPDGTLAEIGEVGELCFRSPQVVKGYWNLPDDTRTSFVEGWFHSGDLGYLDPEGYVYVVDRLKDVVIRGGENVYCAEVEAVLFEHPDILEVAIVGLPDETLGERVCAVAVPRPAGDLTLESIRTYLLGRLAAFKCPEALCEVEELPRTATGKTAKVELRALIASGVPVERSF
jgi:acyl-CoA synthetase (AMP-forming)/AMP-acid ligase II